MRSLALLAALLMSLPMAAPVSAQGMPNSRSGDYNNSGGWRPGDRPQRQRYVCVLDRPDGAARRTSCPADAGRVGGRCRCNGVVGNGVLQTY